MPTALAVDASNPSEGLLDAPSSGLAASTTPVSQTVPQDSSGVCPVGMVHVEVDFCTNQATRCLHETVEKNNHHHICHAFAPPVICHAPHLKHLSFCMDRYEYPNKEGAHPVIHANWYDAASTCNSVGKRLCWESEWTAACEGPEHLPFPYGWDRDPTACNIGRPFDLPYNDRMYSKNPDTQRKELDRLDRSVRSGAIPRCASAFGVHDLTGNVDEWVNSESREAGGLWAALKGGSYIQARNACRPRTTSHEPNFRFYTLGFRCCKDADPTPKDAASATTAQAEMRPQSLLSPVNGFRTPRVPNPEKDHWPEWQGRVLPLWE